MKIMYPLMLLFGITVPVQAADLTVNISNITVKQGSVRVALYHNAKDFPDGKNRLRGQELAADQEKLIIVFKELPAGRYAVAIMQDENDNKVLDRNFLGIPTEPYGFSQREPGETGQPSFEQAALQLANENKTINVTLVK